MKIIAIIILAMGMLGIGGCKQVQRHTIKIMSYNIRHGEGVDGVLDLSRSAHTIQSQAPDFCGLQEVDNYCERSNNMGQTDYLARETGMVGVFSQFMEYDGGEYGMATLSAKPVINTKRLPLPDGLHEPRTAIVQELEITKRCTIVVVNVHFDWIDGQEGITKRLNQAKELILYINTLDKATIITGDFNCTPDSPTMQYFAKQGFVFVDKGEDNLSFQGDVKMEIDHVIYRNSPNIKFKTRGIYLLNEPMVSDHRPLLAELEVIY